jgi:hypothetical protein
MEYQPRREDELRSAMCLTPGDYDFEVVSAMEKVSKSGNDMIEMQLRVFCEDGSTRLIRDWLVPGSDLGDLKLNRFAHATGLEDLYFEGGLSGLACVGASGKVRLTIQADPKYGDQSRVKDYVVPTFEETEPAIAETVPDKPAKRSRKKDVVSEEWVAVTNEKLPDSDIPF